MHVAGGRIALGREARKEPTSCGPSRGCEGGGQEKLMMDGCSLSKGFKAGHRRSSGELRHTEGPCRKQGRGQEKRQK